MGVIRRRLLLRILVAIVVVVQIATTIVVRGAAGIEWWNGQCVVAQLTITIGGRRTLIVIVVGRLLDVVGIAVCGALCGLRAVAVVAVRVRNVDLRIALSTALCTRAGITVSWRADSRFGSGNSGDTTARRIPDRGQIAWRRVCAC